MVLDLNYGAGIPQEVVQQMQKTILVYQQKYKDGYVGRTLIEQRPNVGPLVRKDIVRKIDKNRAQDGISTARISLGGTSPDVVKTKGKDVMHQIYRIDAALLMNEAEVQLDPSRWNSDTSVAMLECMRRENYTIINGDATWGITGIVGAAQSNSRGSITSGTNQGAWAGTETNAVMNPYKDLLTALGYIDPQVRGTLFLGGRPAYLDYLLDEDDLGKVWADKIGTRLMGRSQNDVSWMVPSDYFPANKAYLISKHMLAAELLIPEDYNVDPNYPREKGQQVYAEVGGWVGLEIHTNDFAVEIDIS